ncbi:hypothetical protein [Jonquetella anthropi]|uniref:hypothetical protein n=1 Tax=Jonquetella anthropi TaxID=428712 RepID=UPI0023F2DB57|nr:hypothetical protein [Jonquetella anthropi]
MSHKLFKSFILFVVCLSVVTPAWSKGSGKGKSKTKETPPPVVVEAPKTEEENTKPYITGFNGYEWGTSMELIMKEAKPETRLSGGLLSPIIARSMVITNPNKNHNKDLISEQGFIVQKGFDYYLAVYGKNEDKYPYVCYIGKNGRLVAGGFAHSWDDLLEERYVPTRAKLHDIISYVSKNNKKATKFSFATKNAFGAVLQNSTVFSSKDSAGMIVISLTEGTGLKKQDPDEMRMQVLSTEYLNEMKQVNPPKEKAIPKL